MIFQYHNLDIFVMPAKISQIIANAIDSKKQVTGKMLGGTR